MSDTHDILSELARARAELVDAHQRYLDRVSEAHEHFLDAMRRHSELVASLDDSPDPPAVAARPERAERVAARAPSAPGAIAYLGADPDAPTHDPTLHPTRPVLVTTDRAGLFGPLCDALEARGLRATPIAAPDALPSPPARFDLVFTQSFEDPDDREDADATLTHAIVWSERAEATGNTFTTVQATRAGFGALPCPTHVSPLVPVHTLAHRAPALDVGIDDPERAAAAIADALTRSCAPLTAIDEGGATGFGWIDVRTSPLSSHAPSPLSVPGPVWVVGVPDPIHASALDAVLAPRDHPTTLVLPSSLDAPDWPHGPSLALDIEGAIGAAFDALSELAADPPRVVLFAGRPDDPEEEFALAWAVVALLHAHDACAITLHAPAREALTAHRLDAYCSAHTDHTAGTWRAIHTLEDARHDDLVRALTAPLPPILRIGSLPVG